jgi:hypothetical protein
MDLDELIRGLVSAPKTRRLFDDSIAETLGWNKAFESQVDETTGQIITVQIKKWYPPGSERLKRVPSYTTNLQVALDLVAEVAAGESVGASWGKEEPAHAIIGNGPTLRAATPAMALCAVAMLYLRAKRKTSRPQK